MAMAPCSQSGALTVDKVLGNAYQIVKHVQEHLDQISVVAGMTEDVQILSGNLNAAAGSILAGHIAIMMAGVTNYRATYAEALTDFPEGAYFTSTQSGSLRLYKRTADAPGYVDQGDLVVPLSRSFLGSSEAADAIGTSEENISVQDALNARVKSADLLEHEDLADALDARVSFEALAEGVAGAGVGTTAVSGSNVTAALAGLVPIFGTDVALANVNHAVNTAGKFLGKLAFNSTDNKLYVAQGPAPEDIWRSADGLSQAVPV